MAKALAHVRGVQLIDPNAALQEVVEVARIALQIDVNFDRSWIFM